MGFYFSNAFDFQINPKCRELRKPSVCRKIRRSFGPFAALQNVAAENLRFFALDTLLRAVLAFGKISAVVL